MRESISFENEMGDEFLDIFFLKLYVLEGRKALSEVRLRWLYRFEGLIVAGGKVNEIDIIFSLHFSIKYYKRWVVDNIDL